MPRKPRPIDGFLRRRDVFFGNQVVNGLLLHLLVEIIIINNTIYSPMEQTLLSLFERTAEIYNKPSIIPGSDIDNEL
jgi:hypothetical protein